MKNIVPSFFWLKSLNFRSSCWVCFSFIRGGKRLASCKGGFFLIQFVFSEIRANLFDYFCDEFIPENEMKVVVQLVVHALDGVG